MNADIRPGTLMILHQPAGFRDDTRSIVPVDRVTRTQIIVRGPSGKPRRFRRGPGMEEVGASGYNRPRLEVGTPVLIALVREANRRAALIYRIQSAKLRELSTAQLEAMANAIGGAE